jgi:NAD(P)-dependent dehydrogenase (short-subunit alcohol dehydrogenase family)
MSAQKIAGSVALVTGANRGIGRAITEALLAAGASKVYAAARNTSDLVKLKQRYGSRLELVTLDVTNGDQVAAAAAKAVDVTLLINNAGVVAAPLGASIADAGHFEAGRQEMEVNYFGVLRLVQAFAPVLAKNGGGAIANVSSVVGLSNFPLFASYSVSKAAARSLTQAARVQLAEQGTSVFGVYPGPVDTDMAADLEMDKATPASVAEEILKGLEAGTLEIFPDPFAAQFGQQFEASPSGVERHIASTTIPQAA